MLWKDPLPAYPPSATRLSQITSGSVALRPSITRSLPLSGGDPPLSIGSNLLPQRRDSGNLRAGAIATAPWLPFHVKRFHAGVGGQYLVGNTPQKGERKPSIWPFSHHYDTTALVVGMPLAWRQVSNNREPIVCAI
jgi:hypothetical protein